ncbi:MAG: EAL domain-containing protein [Burkholderiaceae bacterium]
MGEGALERTETAVRARRLIQISSLTIVGLGIIAVRAMTYQRWLEVAALGAGIFTMLLCQLMNRRGATEEANLLLVVALSIMVTFLLWAGEGLRDSALLTFPAVLISAGLLTKPRHVVRLVIAMLLVVVTVAFASIAGWRSDRAPDALIDRTVDVTIILLISGFAVWVMVGDLHRGVARLKIQLQRYRQSQENLTYLSHHDTLTQLPNRILGRSKIEQAIANAHRNGGHVALLFVDLDNFKSINDSLGHTAGDDFLKQVAQRLVDSVRQTDVVSRQGGDEFLIGITDVAQGDAVTAVATKILQRVSEVFTVHGTEISSSCSIGVAVYPQNGNDFETLLRHADISVYHAKDAGRNLFRFYDESMNARMQENLLLIAGLRSAIALGEFVLHYQPVVDIHSGELIGAEALIRWQRPEHGLVAPVEFISTAEKAGLIVDIGAWVIQEACRQAMVWQSAGHAPFVIAVNLSPVQFARGNVEVMLAQTLAESGLEAQYLELELTESTLIQDSEKFIMSLQKLKALGVRISIDDFGTGYSNLSYLQRFSIDKLKIDQSFVRRLLQGPQELAIVSAIIQIARSLKLTTTAEGIEDQATRDRLAEIGCQQGQGFLFAPPLTATEFAQQVLKGRPSWGD